MNPALYLILFIFSIYTLYRQKPAGRRFFIIISGLMFLLGTCDVVFSVLLVGIAVKVNKAQVYGSSDYSHLLQLYNTFFIIDAIVMVANNLVTDVLFTYRCYYVWGARKWVIVGPVLGMVATVATGSLTATGSESLPEILFLSPYISALATSVLLVGLTAGRIWYIRNAASTRVGSQNFSPPRDSVIAIIIESGAIYCAAIVVWVVSQSIIYHFPNDGPESVYIFFGVATGVWSQIVNIAPTLILVRIGVNRLRWADDTTLRPSRDTGPGPGPASGGTGALVPMTFRRNSVIPHAVDVDFNAAMEMNISPVRGDKAW
ncbi:hypothetical protein FB45DRAFT_956740 [Roridomyces roridus]|uniref:Uncharacterized protein n=1 Tax=Roridomyces roridus TaxID=1738132 RepID=A0AAD7AYM0_9AGAR|nr:hypothetical protein FB45DRAFT_956740 [Roridomyces roridus]